MCKDEFCVLAGASHATTHVHIFPNSLPACTSLACWAVLLYWTSPRWVSGIWLRTSRRGQETATKNILEIQSVSRKSMTLIEAMLNTLACCKFAQKLVCPEVCSTIKQERQLELGSTTLTSLAEPVIYEKIN